MQSESILERLYLQIQTELEFCNSQETPFVCSQFNDMDSRAIIVKTIAETAVNREIDIAKAIVEVERLYSLNSID
jgi:hypothetical protein